MIAKASREETNGSEGIEVLVNERFESKLGPGIYTHKIIHLSKYVDASRIHTSTQKWEFLTPHFTST